MIERRIITGFSNPTVKHIRSLRDKKHRRREGRFLAEGLRILTEALEAGHVPETLILSDRAEPHPLIDALEAAVDTRGGEVIETSVDILEKLSGKSNPQTVLGVFALADALIRAFGAVSIHSFSFLNAGMTSPSSAISRMRFHE